jgi:hypothetical protein
LAHSSHSPGSQGVAPLTIIDGFVLFPAGIALRDITGSVRLENVSVADAKSQYMAAAHFSAEDACLPIVFRLNIQGDVDAAHDYIITAEASAIHAGTGQRQKFGTVSAIVWRPGGQAAGLNIDLKPWT